MSVCPFVLSRWWGDALSYLTHPGVRCEYSQGWRSWNLERGESDRESVHLLTQGGPASRWTRLSRTECPWPSRPSDAPSAPSGCVACCAVHGPGGDCHREFEVLPAPFTSKDPDGEGLEGAGTSISVIETPPPSPRTKRKIRSNTICSLRMFSSPSSLTWGYRGSSSGFCQSSPVETRDEGGRGVRSNKTSFRA